MAIQFTLARRSTLPTEDASSLIDIATGQPIAPDAAKAKTLIPRLRTRGGPVDAAKYFDGCPWSTVVNKSLIQLCLGELKRLLLHELCEGTAVTLPGIGTLQVTLRGDIEVRGDHYHGRDVHVDGLRFTPDPELLRAVRHFEVDQAPFGMAFTPEQLDIVHILKDLFATQETITRRDLEAACDYALSKHRLTDLLNRLVSEGLLLREGQGNQTRYRLK
ncbi:MAG: hypothetical protein J5545_12230 [Bacteroidaceae bacterium]|nr:hypothetical protein [Bacteroidaceae bacterium]